MPIELTPPELTELQPRITVMGVGGAGCNAVNNMIRSELQGVSFVVANTDAQSLANAGTESRIQLGVKCTQGLGAGSRPDVGQEAAEEAIADIEQHLDGCHMLFLTAGMGGGTGTGAAPVIARAAREKGILTVGVVTKPFQFEGGRRLAIAEAGIRALRDNVDTLIIIPNQNLFRVATEKTTFPDACAMADDVLHAGVRGITDLMVMPGLINLDFADIRTVMHDMGRAMMGTGESDGEKRAVEAAEAAISNPLLDEVSLKGAKGVIINITGGMDLTLFEVDEAANHIRNQVDEEANIIIGSAFNEALNGQMRVSVVATGLDSAARSQDIPQRVAETAGGSVVSIATGRGPSPDVQTAAGGGAGQIVASSPETNTATDAESAAEPVSAAAGTGSHREPDSNIVDMVGETPYIAPEPIIPETAPEKTVRPDAYLEAAYENAGTASADLSAETTEPGEDSGPAPQETVARPAQPVSDKPGKPSAGPSLFERMTGLRSSRQTPEDPRHSETAASETLGGVSAGDRPVPEDREDAQHEIPGFLRRQAN